MAWEQTIESINNISNTIGSSDSWNASWGVDTVDVNWGTPNALINLGDNLSGAARAGYSNASVSLSNTISGVVNTFTDGNQYVNVADAAGSAVIDYLNSKLERLKKAWTTTRPVTVQAIMGEISPYVTDFGTAIEALTSRLTTLASYLLGVEGSNTGDIVEDLKQLGLNTAYDFTNYITNDPSLQEAVSNMSAVQAYASGLNFITQTISTIQAVLNVIEPVFPFLEIAASLALTIWSGGTSAMEASSKTSEVVQKECQSIIKLVLASIKKVLFKIKLNVPEILLGSMNALSVREAVLSIGDSTNYDSVGGWIQSMFSEDFLADAENSSNWIVSIEDALNNTINWAESANSSLINTITGNDKQWGEVAKNKFLSTFVANFMNQAIQNARKKSYVPNYDSDDWITSAVYDTILGSDFNDSMSEVSSPLDIVLNDNTEENPIYDESSLRIVTYSIFKNME